MALQDQVEVSQAGDNGHDPVWILFNGLRCNGRMHVDYENWRARIKIFFPADGGGLALVADPDDPSIWWVDILAINTMPDASIMRAVTIMAQLAGCKILASQIYRPGAKRIFERFGFNAINKDVMTIRLNT